MSTEKSPHQELRIQKMFAFLATDEKDGVEGVIGMKTDDGWIPMVGADMLMMAKLRPYAVMVGRANRSTVKLAVFSQRTDREVIEP